MKKEFATENNSVQPTDITELVFMHITDSVTAIFAVVAFCAARKQASEAEKLRALFHGTFFPNQRMAARNAKSRTPRLLFMFLLLSRFKENCYDYRSEKRHNR